MFGKRKRRERPHALQFPLAVSYLERLRLIVGNPLKEFPTDMNLWQKEMEMSVPDLSAKYGLTIQQALALQQALFLMFEVSLEPDFKKKRAPDTTRGWAEVPEVQKIKNLPTEHLLMLIADQEGNYTSHLLACGTENHVHVPDVKGIVHLYCSMGGTYFLLAHNHPNNVPRPSEGDIRVARQLRDMLKGTGVDFRDSLITTPNAGWYSLKENGHF